MNKTVELHIYPEEQKIIDLLRKRKHSRTDAGCIRFAMNIAKTVLTQRTNKDNPDSIAQLTAMIKDHLAHLITDLPEPKDGIHHRLQIPVAAEIIQKPLKEIYEWVVQIENMASYQTQLEDFTA